MSIIAINKAPMCPAKLPEGALKTAQDACDRCIIILNQVIGVIQGANLGESDLQLVGKYFMADGTDNQILQRILNVLTLTRDGLQTTELTLTLNNFNSAKSGIPIIHIAPLQFNNPNQLIRYIIHEATHIFAKTGDNTDFGYVKNDGEFKSPGMGQESALVNADSYAVFVVRSYGLPLL